MDPNAAYEEILKICRNGGPSDELEQQARGLLDWISRGGYAPGCYPVASEMERKTRRAELTAWLSGMLTAFRVIEEDFRDDEAKPLLEVDPLDVELADIL